MVRDVYCFLDSNIIFSMTVGGVIKLKEIEISIKHRFNFDVSELKERIRKNKGLALSSSTVLTEITRKLSDVVSDTVNEFKLTSKQDWGKIETNFIYISRVIDEIFSQSCENLTHILSLIKFPPFDNSKSEGLKPKTLEILNKYHDEYLMTLVKKKKCPPPERLHSLERDAKIISDVLVIREDLEKESKQKIKIYFVTMDSFLIKLPDSPKFCEFYKKFDLNFYWPSGDILKLI